MPQKRADRSAKEGVIVTRVSNDGKTGVIVEVNCETDFVARSEDFVGFANAVAEAIEKERPDSLDRVAALPTEGGKKIAERLERPPCKGGREDRREAVCDLSGRIRLGGIVYAPGKQDRRACGVRRPRGGRRRWRCRTRCGHADRRDEPDGHHARAGGSSR